jgi:outer membrane receptor protein involved in Fe transport
VIGRSACRKAWLAYAAAIPCLWGAPAAAQTDQGSAAGAADVGAPEEIIVTSTRRSEALSKVPESVSAFTAAKMDILDVKSFAELAKFTPGVDYNEDSHDISIRGIKSDAGSATTGIYIDDTPIQIRNLGLNANNTLPAVFDLDRVEVLRGPQGTLFGAGSEGGTVRYITRQPGLTDYTGYAHAELAGTEGGGMSFEGGAAVGGPIVEDSLGFRLSGWARRDGGWIDKIDPYTGQTTDIDANRTNTYVVRAALAWQPVEGLTITPSYDFEQRTQNNYDDYWVGLSDRNAGKFIDGTPEHMMDPDRFHLATVKIQYDLDDVQIISNTSYYDRLERLNGYSGTLYNLSYFQHYTSAGTDPQGSSCINACTDHSVLLTPNGINLPGFGPYVSINYITNTQRSITQETRIQSSDPDARLSWVGGVFYTSEAQRSTEEINDPQLPALTQYLWGENLLTAWGQNLLPNGDDYVNDTVGNDSQVALFGDVTLNVFDGLKLTAGLRYAWTHFDFHNLNTGAQDLLDDGGLPAKASGAKDETPVTPKFGATYNFTPDDMIYTTIAKGYRIGGASPPLPVAACGGVFPTSYNSDTLWSYEVGAKDRFLDRTLQLSGSLYYVEWNNIQQAIYVPTCGIQYTTNVGQATSEGFDLQANWQATHNLEFDLAIGYTDAKYSKDAKDPSTGLLLAAKGDSLDVAPWSATLGAQYNFLIHDYEAFARADYEFTGQRHRAIPGEDPQTEYYDAGLRPDPAVHQVSLRTGITLDSWEFNLFMENVLNAHPQLNLAHQDSGTALYTAESLRPRTTGITASYRY